MVLMSLSQGNIRMVEPDLSHIHTTNKQHNVTSGEEKWLEKFI